MPQPGGRPAQKSHFPFYTARFCSVAVAFHLRRDGSRLAPVGFHFASPAVARTTSPRMCFNSALERFISGRSVSTWPHQHFISENPFLYRAAGVYLTGVHSLLAEVPIWPRLRSLRKGLPGIFQRRPLQRGASEWDVHARRATEHGKEATLLFWDPRRASHIQRGRSWLNVRRHVLTDRRGEVKRLRPRRNWVRAEHGEPN